MDRFHELNAFIAVVEAGGFSAAARRTGESQSAISKAIGALEKRLGVMLFNRSTRSVTLTDQGRRYYARAKPLVDEMDEADSELSTLDANSRSASGYSSQLPAWYEKCILPTTSALRLTVCSSSPRASVLWPFAAATIACPTQAGV